MAEENLLRIDVASGLRAVASAHAVAARLFLLIGLCIRARPIPQAPTRSGNVKDAVMKRCRSERRRQVRTTLTSAEVGTVDCKHEPCNVTW